jgi:hypothetical protein
MRLDNSTSSFVLYNAEISPTDRVMYITTRHSIQKNNVSASSYFQLMILIKNRMIIWRCLDFLRVRQNILFVCTVSNIFKENGSFSIYLTSK